MAPFMHMAIRLAHPDEENVVENLPMTPTTQSDDEEDSHRVVLTGPSTPKSTGSSAPRSSATRTAAFGIIETPTPVPNLKPDGKSGKKKRKKKKKKKAKAKEEDVKNKDKTKKTAEVEQKETKKKEKKKKENIVARFAEYFGPGTLEDWQRLCQDLGLEGEFTSKNQCRKALGTIHVNIYDFLDAVKAGKEVKRFRNEWALAHYCRMTGKIYPKKKAKGGPVRALLRHVF